MKYPLWFRFTIILILSTFLLNSCAAIFGSNTEKLILFTNAKDVNIIVNNFQFAKTEEISEHDIKSYPSFNLEKNTHSKAFMLVKTQDLIILQKEGYITRNVKLEKDAKFGFILLDLIGGTYLAFTTGIFSVLSSGSGLWSIVGVLPLLIDITTSNLTQYSDNVVLVDITKADSLPASK